MSQETFSAPKFERQQVRAASVVSRRRRFPLIAVSLSVGAHVFAALLIVFLPRVLSDEPHAQEQGAVELLMVEQKGTEENPAAQRPGGKPVRPENTEPPTTETHPEASALSTPPVAPSLENGEQPAAPNPGQAPPKSSSADTTPTPEQAAERPRQAGSQEAPVFNLEGTESESNAVALGSGILPAMPDDRFRNRPPVYPAEAEMRGQHGAVVVLIHVSESGLATGVDVMESSGVDLLDQAAIAAVRKWHFRPAMRAGRALPFDMPFRFIFQRH